MATNLEVGEYKNIGEKTCVAPSLNFMFVPSNQNKHAVAKCCVQLGRFGKWREVGDGGMGVGAAENASSFFAAFCHSRKTLEKMAEPSHPCLKPSLHIRQISFLSFPSSWLAWLALPRAPNPVWPPDDTAVHWRESLLSMSICKKCPLQPFLSPEWRLVGSTN